MDFGAMMGRVMRAVRLDVTLYNEVEADTSLNREALTVVVIAALLTFVGSLVSGLFSSALGLNIGVMLLAAVAAAVWAIVGYYVWAYLTWFIGTRFFGGTAEPGELLRTLGYAYAPQALGVFGFIPCVGALVALAGSLWSLVCGVIAIREALDFDTTKAVITALIGWAVIFVVSLIIGGIFGLGAMAAGGLMSGL